MILMWHSASLAPRKWLLHWYHICEDLLPMAMYLKKSHPVMRPSLGFLGGFFMMSRSGGLKPRAVAGSPSVTRFTHRSWTGIRASGIPRAAVRKILKQEHRIMSRDSENYRISGIFCVGLLFCRVSDLPKIDKKIDTAKIKPYSTSSLRVLEIAKIGLGENLTLLPSVIFAKISPTWKIPDIWYGLWCKQ